MSLLEQKLRDLIVFCESGNINTTVFLVILAAIFFFYKRRFELVSVMEGLGQVAGNLTRDFRHRMLGRWAPRSVEQEERVIKRGGYVAGLLNDGNTCFVNSVLQSLASSTHLLQFLDDEIANVMNEDEDTTDVEEQEEKEGSKEVENTKGADLIQRLTRKSKVYGKRKKKQLRSTDAESLMKSEKPQLNFTITLKELLDSLNAKHYRNKPYFKTKKLLTTMSKAPNKNIILGYDQEDAQEFFQTLLYEIEKDIQSIHGKPPKNPIPVAESLLLEDAIVGSEKLGKVGTIYIPTEQIDPNSILKDKTKNFTPFKLLTPFDGITAERIGCLNCGENGGVRYSLFSGLSLNLPNENIGSTLKLSELLHEWAKPEIIEGVECNRCALTAVKELLEKKLEELESVKDNELTSAKLTNLIKYRLDQLEDVLSKPAIDDEDYKKLHTENTIRKCSKSKQILIARPPPLLSIHINRSVFDPRTFMIRKNNSRVLFKPRLNLSPLCCDINDVNLDARLPMSKKAPTFAEESSEEEPFVGEYYSKVHRRFQAEFEDDEECDEGNDEELGQYQYRNGKDVPQYDPLDDEYSSSSEDGQDMVSLEVDALGNTIPKSKPAVAEDSSSDEDVGKEVESEFLEKPLNDEADILDEDDVEYDASNEREDVDNGPSDNNVLPPLPEPTDEPVISNIPVGPLIYSLRSVIVHYGSHNYGHYIAFRKFRGVWWSISDETVYIVDEAEVLSTPGVFMLFYEYDYNEATGRYRDDPEYLNESNTVVDVDDEYDSLTGSTKTSIQDDSLND